MKLSFLFLILFFVQSANAAPSCSDFFSKRSAATESLEVRAQRLYARIQNLRETRTLPPPHEPPNRWRVSSRDLAEPILKHLKERENKIDFEIFESLVTVFEITRGNYEEPGFSYHDDFEPSLRPRTHLFEPSFWNLENITEYFFDSYSSLRHLKERDLEYLRHVLATARSKQFQDINQVLQKAELSWHMKKLTAHPELVAELRAWMGEQSLTEKHRQFRKTVATWIAASGDASERQARIEFLKPSMKFARTTKSYLDFYLLERYFAEVRFYHRSLATAPPVFDATVQMTHWNALEHGLSTGSMRFMSEFLAQTSHDTERKIFVLRTLNQMSASRGADDFTSAYQKSFKEIESRTVDAPAPEQFQSDLHIFTIAGLEFSENYFRTVKIPRGFLESPRAVHVVAAWNKKLGQLDTTVERTVSLSNEKETLLTAMPEVIPLADKYFEFLAAKGTITDVQLQAQRQREYNAMIARTTFFIAMEPGKFQADSLVAMGRIFYGGPRWLGWNTYEKSLKVPGIKTYVEQDFPRLVLEERKKGAAVHELGRLLTTPRAGANARVGVVRFMAEYFENVGARGTAIMDGGKAATRMYEAMGASIAAGPAELGIPENYNPVWVLRVPVQQIRHDYFAESFETIRLRSVDKPSR